MVELTLNEAAAQATILFQSGQFDACLDLCRAIRSVLPYDQTAMYLEGLVAAHQERLAEAEDLFWRVATLDHDHADAQLMLGRMREARGNDSGAAYAYRRAAAIGSPPAAALYAAVAARTGGEHRLRYWPPPSCQITTLPAIYEVVFGYRTHGRFLEIGAFDGESYSNSCFLADIGWEGTYVEPVPAHAAACRVRHRHNRVKIVEAAIGDAAGHAEISIAGSQSTLSAAHIAASSQLDWGRGQHVGTTAIVTVITPAMLLEQVGPGPLDLMVIDVEGLEWPIIRAFDWSICRPHLLIVETREHDMNFPAAMRDDSASASAHLRANGYRTLAHEAGNDLMIDATVAETATLKRRIDQLLATSNTGER